VHLNGVSGKRPLCCGRTFLSAGLVDEAKAEARRSLDALLPFARRSVAIVGLEPSCLLGMRDEFLDYGFGDEAKLVASQALMLEEFLVREREAGRLALELHAVQPSETLLHAHCHQKAFGAVSPIEKVLGWIPELTTRTIESSCCGMAGAFGYEAEHYDVSMRMDHVYKMIELVGSSTVGTDAAIQNAIARASKTVKHIDWFQVTEQRGHVEKGKIAHYQVTLKVGFRLE